MWDARFTAECGRRCATGAWGCLTGFEPVRPRVTAESLSHLGQGTSRSGRTRTCGLPGVGRLLSPLSY